MRSIHTESSFEPSDYTIVDYLDNKRPAYCGGRHRAQDADEAREQQQGVADGAIRCGLRSRRYGDGQGDVQAVGHGPELRLRIAADVHQKGSGVMHSLVTGDVLVEDGRVDITWPHGYAHRLSQNTIMVWAYSHMLDDAVAEQRRQHSGDILSFVQIEQIENAVQKPSFDEAVRYLYACGIRFREKE